MDDHLKAHLADKLAELLHEAGETQANLAKSCAVKQGLVADHMRKKAYPRMPLLFKYWQFFKERLGRPLTLYELTGLDVVKEFECQTRAAASADEVARKFLAAYQALPENDPRRQAINTLLQINDD